MKAVITHDKLEIQDNTLYNSGSIDYYEIDTEFTSDWDNLTKYAIINGAEAVKIPVVANKVKVDRNTSGTYYIGFVGYTIDDDKKTFQISTNLQPIYFQIGAGELPAADPQDLPDPTTWETYLSEIQAIVDGAENVNITAEKIDKTTYINVTDKTGTTETVEVLDGIDGPGVAEGGTTGQILVKKSDEDFDTEWVDNVTSYNDLTDKPSINNVELGGNKSLSDLGIKQEYTKSDVGLGNVDNVRQYSASNPPPYPVNSVNGQTGTVVIDTHDDLIPTQASSTNKLTTENFVNSTVATSTATFRGTFNSLAELEQVTADENDYGFVVGTDTAGNTVYNRYKYASGTWVFEYALNNSSFTAAQWEAIQSGITDDLVTKLQGIEANAEVNIIEGVKIGNTTQTVTNKIVEINPDTTPVENSTNVIDSNAVYEVEKLLPTDRDSGENVDIDNAQPYKVLNVVADGKYQQESTTGKNLLNVDTDLAVTRMYTLNNISIPAGTYHLTNTSATCSDGSSNVTIRFDPERAIYNLSTSQDRTITLTEEATVMYVFAKTDYPTSADLTATVKELMLSTSGGTYEPYTGGIPSPSPDFPQTITQVTSAVWNRTGNNLFDNQFEIGNYGGTNWSGKNDNPRRLRSANFIKVKPNTTYYMSTGYYNTEKGSLVCQIAYYPKADFGTGYLSKDSSWKNINRVFITPDNCYAIRLLFSYGEVNMATTDISNVQIEEGSSATTYSPYQGQTIPIDLDGNEVCATDTIKDKLLVDRYGNVAIQKNVGKRILNGSEEGWAYAATISRFGINQLIQDYSINNRVYSICDYYTYGDTTLNGFFALSGNNNALFMHSPNDNINTIPLFQAWLSTYKPKIYYPLATPTIIPLPKLSTLPTTLKGINHIWLDTNLGRTAIEVEYVKDLSLDIPTKTSELTNDANFVKNTDYATSSTGGVFKTGGYGTAINNAGQLYLYSQNYATYLTLSDGYFIGKGTLENVLTERIGTIETALTTLDTGSGV